MRIRRGFASLCILGLGGCSGSGEGLDANGRPLGEGGDGPLTADFQSIQDHVFTPICTQCHAGAAAPQGLRLEQGVSYGLLVGVASQEVPSLQRVAPGDPDHSYLVHKISGNQEVGERMPRGLPPLPAETIAVIRQWIADGALPPGGGPAPDTTAPTVTAHAPAGDLAGTVTLTADAADDTGVTQVQFLVDGNVLGGDESASYSISWDTTLAANGTHVVTARAHDAAGNVGESAPVTVTVANPTSDTTPPTVALHAPAGELSGTVSLTADASDDVGVAQVEFFADGISLGIDNAAPFALDWDTTQAGDGAHTLTAQARDAAGNVGTSAPVDVTVDNATLTWVQDHVFTPICSACHDGSNPLLLPGSMNLSTRASSYMQTVGVTSEENPPQQRIAPGQPDASYLIRKIEGDAGIAGSRMPAGCPDSQPCLDDATIARMRQWVSNGAKNN